MKITKNAIKGIVCSIFTVLIFNQTAWTQQSPIPCSNDTDPPGETACLATPICGFNGYCGRTLSSYTADAWPALASAIITCSQSGFDQLDINNDSYLKFMASSSTITFNVYVYNCTKPVTTKAIQLAIFSAADCASGPVNVVYCNKQMMQQATPHNVTVNGLTPGQIYYILIDGYSSQNCGYTFEAVAGVGIPGVAIDVAPSVTVCAGDQINATASGGGASYTWAGAAGLSSTSGATVTITPPSTPGTYEYTVSSNGGTSMCPQNSGDTLSITVNNCGCTPPTLNIQNISFCNPNSANLNNAIGAGSDPATLTFYNSQNDANNGTNPIGNTVSTAGTYWVRAVDPNDPSCFQVYQIDVTLTSFTYTANITDENCGANDGSISLTANGGASPYDYSINNGTTFQVSNAFNGLAANSYNIVIEDANGCITTGTENVGSIGGPTIDQITPTPASCFGDCNGQLSASVSGGSAPYTYNWTLNGNVVGSNSANITNLCAGTYTLEVVGNDGCSVSMNAQITQPSEVQASFTASSVTGTAPIDITFTNNSVNANAYTWDFGNGQNSTSSNSTVTSSYTSNGDYLVTLIASNGLCKDTTSISIHLFPGMTFHIPNVFTPNNDNANDVFFIETHNAKSLHVEIFNRWGNSIKTFENINDEWDGKDFPAGVYFFKYKIVDLNDISTEGHGFVHLIK